MVTRKEQKEQRRQEILEAALQLFIRKGYAGTKVGDIADAVGMSTGLMFHYFESKEKLYEELVRLGASGPTAVLGAHFSTPLEFFETTTEGIFSAIEQSSFVASMFVLMSQATFHENGPQSARDMVHAFDAITPTVEIIKQGQREGSIRAGDPTALAVAYWGAIQGIAEELAFQPLTPLPESTWIVDIVRKR